MNTATPALKLSRLPSPSALAALFALTLRQHLHGRRMLVLALLFLLPSALAVAYNLLTPMPIKPENLQFALVFNLIPHALAPLTALLYAAGIVQDEIEEQTLTYLLLRPVPRWAMYLIKLAATWLVTTALTAVFTVIAMDAVVLTTREPVAGGLTEPILKLTGLIALTQAAYCGLFGLLGLLMRRSLVVGVAYIFLLEGILASLDMVMRRMTVLYHFRVLAIRWLNPEGAKAEWSINLAKAPDAQTCVLTLLGIGLVLAVFSALLFSSREFRMKTPEGN
jgi:ABC-2 type transport system permease protein